jgi:hypothetical protein
MIQNQLDRGLQLEVSAADPCADLHKCHPFAAAAMTLYNEVF